MSVDGRSLRTFIAEMQRRRRVWDALERGGPDEDFAVEPFPLKEFSGRMPELNGPVGFSDCKLLRTDWRDASATGASMNNATVVDSLFDRANLDGAQMTTVRFERCQFLRTGLGAQLRNVTFTDCTFEKTRFGGATFDSVTFERCRLDRVFMYDVDLASTRVINAQIVGPVFGTADSDLFS